jgi:hypothetical protein
MRGTPRIAALAAVAGALGLAACGPTPPQAPVGQAMRLGQATGAIANSCGRAYRVTAFPGAHRRRLSNLDADAAPSARMLAAVYQRNRAWIYLGETVDEIVGHSLAYLHRCGLGRAESVLRRETR